MFGMFAVTIVALALVLTLAFNSTPLKQLISRLIAGCYCSGCLVYSCLVKEEITTFDSVSRIIMLGLIGWLFGSAYIIFKNLNQKQ